MTAKPKQNPERWMLLLFPLITLGLFVLAIVLYYYLPQFLGSAP